MPVKFSPLSRGGRGLTVYLCSVTHDVTDLTLAISGGCTSAIDEVFQRVLSGEFLVDADARQQRLDDKVEEGLESAPPEGSDVAELRKSSRGQGRFRADVLKLEGSCRLTGISDPSLLIASHIKPWRNCSPTEKLDANNGLALTPNADRLFDHGLISFSDEGAF